jgi:uncharacterized protein (TIGR02118 family)
MTTRITVIFDNPVDADAFEARYPAHLELARALPSVTRIETAKVLPKEDGSPTPAYRFIDLYFDDYETASQAVTTDEAAAFVKDVFDLATGGVRLTFSDVEEA